MRGEEEINCLTWVKQNLYGNSVQYYCDDLQRIIRILKSAEPIPHRVVFRIFYLKTALLSTFKLLHLKKQEKGRCISRRKHIFIMR